MLNIMEVIQNSVDYKTYNKVGFSIGSYTDIINSFEFEVLLRIDDDDYQGDTRVLFKDRKTNKIGYLLFGWGSCSGCDALEGCCSWEELEELQLSLYNSIKWLTETEMLNYFKEHDWGGDYTCSSSEQKNFVNNSIKILEELIENQSKIIPELKYNWIEY